MFVRLIVILSAALTLPFANGAASVTELTTLLHATAEGAPGDRAGATQKFRGYIEQYPLFFLQNGARLYLETMNVELRQQLEDALRPIVREQLYDRPLGFIGINMAWEPLPPTLDESRQIGIKILSVLEGHPASRAGIEADDWLIEVDGRPVKELESINGFIDYVASLPPGMLLDLSLRRGPQEFNVELILGSRPGASPRVGGTRNLESEMFFQAWLEQLPGDQNEEGLPSGHFD